MSSIMIFLVFVAIQDTFCTLGSGCYEDKTRFLELFRSNHWMSTLIEVHVSVALFQQSGSEFFSCNSNIRGTNVSLSLNNMYK